MQHNPLKTSSRPHHQLQNHCRTTKRAVHCGRMEEEQCLVGSLKIKFCMDSEVRSEGAYPLYGALSRLGLDPSQLSYNLC